MTGAIFDLKYLSYFGINFKNSCAYHVANFLNFLKLTQLLYFVWIEADKIAKKSGSNIVGHPVLNYSLFAQEISSGEMSEVTKKVKKGQVIRLDVDSCCDSSYVNSNVDELDDLFELITQSRLSRKYLQCRVREGKWRDGEGGSFWQLLGCPPSSTNKPAHQNNAVWRFPGHAMIPWYR